MGLRDQLLADAKEAKKPVSFLLTGLNGMQGREVCTHKLSPLEWRQWFWFKYPDKGIRPLIERLHVEMFKRCCVDDKDVRQFNDGDEGLIEKEFPAGALREFYEESIRVNDMSEVDEDRARERANFFERKSILLLAGKGKTDGKQSKSDETTGSTPSKTS